MGKIISRGVIGFIVGVGILTLAFVLAVAYWPGFEAFFTGYHDQVVQWGHQIHQAPDTVTIRTR